MRHAIACAVLFSLATPTLFAQRQLRVADLPAIDPEAMLRHVKVLASDEFEGRAPGTRGEDRTVDYLAAQFAQMGLAPGAADGTYVQPVPLVSLTAAPAPLTTTSPAGTVTLKWLDDFVAFTKRMTDEAALRDSELVFVGYGVEAPEFAWDDFKGVDVAGKTLVVLVNDPPVPAPGAPGTLDPKTFGGPAMTYYGRWTYKYEIGAAKKAAGVLIVHETGPAGYPWGVVQGFAGEQLDVVAPDRNMGRAAIEGWITLDQARRLFATAGQDFDTLKARAATREFRPVPLGVTASIRLTVAMKTITSRNVIARLAGADPALRDECVLFSAHWDHLGIGEPVDGDRIYNGAKDNASGTAALLELARAFTRLKERPKRSILFLAVTGEEQGLLGSQHYALNPVVPLARTLATINMDGMNVNGRTRDFTVVGLGNSELDDYLRDAAREQDRVIRPDPEPEKGYYYRSDHFNFAKLGVPSLATDEGVEFVGKPEGYGRRVREQYTSHDYHQPSDQVNADWDLSGLAEDTRLLFAVGYRVAQAERYPEWKPGTEFKAIREAQLKAATK